MTCTTAYLLKDRVSRVGEFTDGLRRVAAGGTAMDPEVISQLLLHRDSDSLSHLTRANTKCSHSMAEGHDNTAISGRLAITHNAVHKHIGNIFAKLGLSTTDGGHRRVQAVLTYLDHR